MDKNWKPGDLAYFEGDPTAGERDHLGILLKITRQEGDSTATITVNFFTMPPAKVTYSDSRTKNLGPATDLEQILYNIVKEA